MTQPKPDEIVYEHYWQDPAFHVVLQSVPFKQEDVNGNTIANIHDHYFKKVQGQLVMARVPENLGIPDAWEPVPNEHFWRDKALSMLGPDV